MLFEIAFKKDLNFGIDSEDKNLEILQNYFKCKLKKTDSKNEFDFIDREKKILIELKTRKNKLNKYPTTMIGYNKIKQAVEKIKDGYVIYLCFQFEDYLTYYKFEQNYPKWRSIGGRGDRGREEYKQYYYIPIDKLKTIVI